MKKINLYTRFAVFRPIASVTHFICCGEEVRNTTAYKHQGKYRQNELSSIFQYTISGNGIFENRHGIYPVVAGSGFLCMASDKETSYYYPEDATDPWHFVFFNFLGTALVDTIKELTERNGPVFSIENNNPVMERMLHLIKRNEYHLSFSESAGIASSFFNLLFQTIEVGGDKETQEIELVRSAKNHIQQYLLNDLNASEVARVLNVSREHLSRVFSREAGITLYQYIIREKILYACSLLKDTNMSVKEISIELGFIQPSHLNRTFLRLIKMTPRQFRQHGIMPIFPA